MNLFHSIFRIFCFLLVLCAVHKLLLQCQTIQMDQNRKKVKRNQPNMNLVNKYIHNKINIVWESKVFKIDVFNPKIMSQQQGLNHVLNTFFTSKKNSDAFLSIS